MLPSASSRGDRAMTAAFNAQTDLRQAERARGEGGRHGSDRHMSRATSTTRSTAAAAYSQGRRTPRRPRTLEVAGPAEAGDPRGKVHMAWHEKEVVREINTIDDPGSTHGRSQEPTSCGHSEGLSRAVVVLARARSPGIEGSEIGWHRWQHGHRTSRTDPEAASTSAVPVGQVRRSVLGRVVPRSRTGQVLRRVGAWQRRLSGPQPPPRH